MHALLIVLVILLGIVALCLAVIAYVLLTAFFAVQPIISQLGKISMVIDGTRFVWHRIANYRKRRARKLRRSEESVTSARSPDADRPAE
ncbi:hypothetical protein JI721_13495 [Alicyclobacillus cycloheptanicus]|uniref:Type VI protein secretion system component VasK n=1 Tax=Alicyclobacillus cycloheptanicus TaxID=1457 RepID=A0ABT9XE90_9BACL|nr:hypothetical protein [Alicyclobacillus cycloheptanicus]MDQ0188619.1 type VI protein secretion system component VasK [Alicyclobacillus cycloheptanicus]WDM00701.1 hypothetical protein JI721_13495 [Alicyclobacillus cycloheptanicus]